VSYYIVVVVFVQNVVVAFILESYMRQRGKTKQRQGGRWGKLNLSSKDTSSESEGKTRLSPAQKTWLIRMYRGLRVVMDSADVEHGEEPQGMNITGR
jgi:hypothetical protein